MNSINLKGVRVKSGVTFLKYKLFGFICLRFNRKEIIFA